MSLVNKRHIIVAAMRVLIIASGSDFMMSFLYDCGWDVEEVFELDKTTKGTPFPEILL